MQIDAKCIEIAIFLFLRNRNFVRMYIKLKNRLAKKCRYSFPGDRSFGSLIFAKQNNSLQRG